MLSFILCEDNETILNDVKKIINRKMLGGDIDYKIYTFDRDCNELDKTIQDCEPKIYILDIELSKGSGLDISRRVREANDWKSVIIILTAHNELMLEAYKSKTMILDFINKLDDYKRNLERVLAMALKILNKEKVYTYKYYNAIIRIPLDSVLYISKDNSSKTCLIKTTNREFSISKNISAIKEELDDRFVYSHRSCIVNTEQISKVDYRNSKITFHNGENIDLISRKYRKELEKYVVDVK